MQKLLLFASLLTCPLITFSQTAMLSDNFETNSKRYEFQLFRLDEHHVMFKICQSATVLNCSSSNTFLNGFDKVLYGTDFNTLVNAHDPSLAAFLNGDTAAKAKYDAVKDSLYTKSIEKIQEKTPEQKQIQGLQEVIKALSEEDPQNEAIGALIMRKGKTVPVRNLPRDVARTHTVKKIELTIIRGSIARRGLKVTLDDGSIYFNKQSPINFPRFFKRKADDLARYDARRDSAKLAIQLGDVLEYDFFGTLNYPADGHYVLTTEKPVDTLRLGTALNNLIEVAAYTDLLALIGRKPNGLLQTEISGNFITNTGNFKNSDIIMHTFVRPYVRIAKFDSKFASLDSTRIRVGPGGKDTVNRSYLNQITYLQGGIKFNIISFGLGVNQRIALNGGADINLVNADSVYGKDIIFFNYYPELTYSVTRVKNFSMDCSFKFLGQRIGDNSDVVNREFIWVFTPQVTINYYTSKKEENRIYFRFGYFDNLDDSRYNFSQFQLGYKTSLKLK